MTDRLDAPFQLVAIAERKLEMTLAAQIKRDLDEILGVTAPTRLPMNEIGRAILLQTVIRAQYEALARGEIGEVKKIMVIMIPSTLKSMIFDQPKDFKAAVNLAEHLLDMLNDHELGDAWTDLARQLPELFNAELLQELDKRRLFTGAKSWP